MLNNDLRNIHHHGGAGTIAGGNISASSRLGPLPTSSVDFQSWQTAASAGANPAAASPFYNLQRLPSYYPALPQFNPAYLQFWQQNTAWQQPAAAVATAQQLQQQQQQQINQKQQQSLMSEPLMDSSSWMSATVSSDLGMQSSGAQASAAHFRAPTIQQSVPVPPSQQSLASASAVQNQQQQQQQQSVAQRFATNFATGMMPT
ncbi:unnamed protein product, partial [Anisakis simplex]|uniref:Uncharacterized protein n=1 Tax=Anisakis simplex TaxID=6269 RepID=A0A0M3KJ50_ANISI